MPSGKKNVQRTKGNTRPSSSGRSAQKLLQTYSGHELTLIKGSHLGLTGIAASSPGVGEDLDSQLLDENFRVLLKKMTKKDSTTRLKALQEFKLHCSSCTDESLLSALPYWPRLFNKLSMDADRRIREATNVAHTRIIERIKKNLAPYLKSIIGNWLLAMNDTYAPAASAAQRAFEAAFSPAKQIDVFVFCKEDIMELIIEYLLNLTPQTLADADLISPDELEDNYQRIVTCTMLAFVTLLEKLPPQEHEKLTDAYNKIVSNGQFWKFGGHKLFSIRGAWLKVITAFSRTSSLAVILNPHLGKLVSTVLSNLDESDPCVAFAAWESILQIINTYNDCWKYINLKKIVLPKLWKTLKQGCFGNASMISTFLLPFLSEVIKQIDSSNLDKFFDDFFSNFREGLITRSIRTSFTEFAAFITAYMECLKYVMMELVKSDHAQTKHFLISQLFPVIESCFTSHTPSSQNASAFNNQLTSLVRYIHHQSLIADGNPAFKEIESEFWQLLNDQYLPIVASYDEPKTTVLENISCLLIWFTKCDKSVSEVKLQRKIRFEEASTLPKPEARSSSERSNDLLVTELDSPLNLFVTKCFSKGLEGYSSKYRSLIHLKFVASIFSAYPCEWLLNEVLNVVEDDKTDGNKLGRTFYDEIIKKFILQEERKEESSSIFTSLIFTTVSFIDNHNSVLTILKDICTSTNNVFIHEALVRLLRGTLSSDAIYNEWLESTEFTALIMEYVGSLFINAEKRHFERDAKWRLLTQFVIHSVQAGGLFVEKLTIYLLEQLRVASQRKSQQPNDFDASPEMNVISNDFDQLIKLLTEYMDTNKRTDNSPPVQSLVYLLFQILCQVALGDSFIETKLADPLRNLFFGDGTRLILSGIEDDDSTKIEDLECLKKCADYVHDLLLRGDLSLTADRLSTFGNWIRTWLDAVANGGGTTVKGTSWDIVMAILPNEEEWLSMLHNLYESVAMDILFRIKWPLSFAITKDREGASTISHEVVMTLANFILEMIESFMAQSDGGKFYASLVGLAGVSGYCKILMANGMVVDSKLRVIEEWVKRQQSDFWPTVMKTSICKKLLNRCVELAQSSHFIWIEAVSALLASHKSRIANLENVVTNETIANSCNLLQACVPNKPCLAMECCTSLLQDVRKMTEQPLNDKETSDAFLKLRICLKNLKLKSEEKVDFVIQLTETLLLFSGDNIRVTDCDQNDRNSILRSASFVSLLVEVVLLFEGDYNFASELWDFILCSLGTVIKICCENQINMTSLEMSYLRTNVFSLLEAVSSKISYMEENESENRLVVEWREFFADKLFHPTIDLFYSFSENFKLGNDYVLKSIVRCFKNVSLSTLENNTLTPKLVSSWDENDSVTPAKIKYLLNRFCPLLLSEKMEFRLGAYLILIRVAVAFPRYLQQGNLKEIVQDEESSDVNWYLPGAFVDVLKRASNAVSVILAEVPFGESIELQPDSTIYSVIHGYLLSACLLFNTIGSGPSEWKTRWANALRAHGLLNELVNHLFSFVNEDGFSKEPTFIIEKPSIKDLANLAGFVYMEAVRRLPVLVREWWNSLDRKSATHVDKITSRFVTPKIISKDFNAITEVKKLDNLSLLARPIAREVVATYMVEEVSFELVVQLADNHPLGPVNIQCSRCVGVSKSQWNYWMLQLTTSITQRNGSILDALVLWKCHVDRMFEGAEECFVCYTILGANFQLPKLGCNTCKKKFHSSCLFKWFNTSGHSTCPLCRSIF